MTGGTAGVGRAAVREFGGVGYDVAVLARGAAGLRGAVAGVEAAGRRALAIPPVSPTPPRWKRRPNGSRAIRFLAEHPRRSIWVGVSTAYTILGERVAPLLVRAFLARTGVSGQQTDADLPRYGAGVRLRRS